MSLDQWNRFKTSIIGNISLITKNKIILEYINTHVSNINNSSSVDLLTENGTLQQDIQSLYKKNKELQEDLDTAIAQDKLLRSRNTNINTHSLFLLDHPIKKSIFPYLWVISILFIGIGIITCILFFQMNTNTFVISFNQIGYMLYSILTSPIIYISLFVSLILVIIVLSLKVAGIF